MSKISILTFIVITSVLGLADDFKEAKHLYKSAQYQEAADRFKTIVAGDGKKSAVSHLYYGICLLHLKETRLAIKELRTSYKLAPHGKTGEYALKVLKEYGKAPKPGISPPPVDLKKEHGIFAPYMADLQRRIKRAWFPPKSNESKSARVIFKIHKNGTMSDLRLEKSSGKALFDSAALKAVQNASPFRPLLIKGAGESETIQFTFDYNVTGGPGKKTEKASQTLKSRFVKSYN